MERKITNDLIKWKVDNYKKALLLYGVTGCGKTYTILDFGKNEYKNVVYFDCINNLELNYVFEKNTTVDKLIRGLSAISLETIFKGETLIVFDNVTEQILTYLKKVFANNYPYHIIAITNSNEIVENVKKDFIIKKMGLVDFEEYLKFVGKEQLISFIEESFKTDKSMPFHAMAYELFNEFILTGGYPESIIRFNDEKNYNLLTSYHEKNLQLMKNKLFNLDNLIDIKRSNELLDNISFQLLKENKKFVYGLVRPGGRAKDYEKAIDYMAKNNLIIKCNKITKLESPLSKIKEEDSFKLYLNDSGLLYKKMNVSSNRLLTNDKLVNILYENNVVSALSQNGFNLYYYHSEGKSEVDLVIQTRTGKIIPIEILEDDENNRKSKSLGIIIKKYEVPLAIRFTYNNFSYKNNVKYVPFYAAFCVKENM